VDMRRNIVCGRTCLCSRSVLATSFVLYIIRRLFQKRLKNLKSKNHTFRRPILPSSTSKKEQGWGIARSTVSNKKGFSPFLPQKEKRTSLRNVVTFEVF
jgi:hypothetical protein